MPEDSEQPFVEHQTPPTPGAPPPVAPPPDPPHPPATAQPPAAPIPALKNLTAKEVAGNVAIYVAVVGAFLIPLLLLSYAFASQAEWYAVRRLPELAAYVPAAGLRVPQEGHEWLQFWNKPTFPVLQGKLDFSPSLKAADQEQARIRSQYEELLSRVRHHGSGLSKLFGIYVSSIVMTGVTSAVAAILLLFITASGWNNAHNYAKAIFLVAVATAGYCIAFPKIFLLDENMTANKEHYLAYIALTDEVCSYAATGEGYMLKELPASAQQAQAAGHGTTDPAKNPKVTPSPSETNTNEIARQRYVDPAAFIAYMDYELKHWNAVAVGFDASKNPDFRKLFDEWLKSK
jgi:hypothetical protein